MKESNKTPPAPVTFCILTRLAEALLTKTPSPSNSISGKEGGGGEENERVFPRRGRCDDAKIVTSFVPLQGRRLAS